VLFLVAPSPPYITESIGGIWRERLPDGFYARRHRGFRSRRPTEGLTQLQPDVVARGWTRRSAVTLARRARHVSAPGWAEPRRSRGAFTSRGERATRSPHRRRGKESARRERVLRPSARRLVRVIRGQLAGGEADPATGRTEAFFHHTGLHLPPRGVVHTLAVFSSSFLSPTELPSTAASALDAVDTVSMFVFLRTCG